MSALKNKCFLDKERVCGDQCTAYDESKKRCVFVTYASQAPFYYVFATGDGFPKGAPPPEVKA